MRSIERTLLAWILGALTLGAVLVALVTYLVTLEEMNEMFDADLRNVAEAVSSFSQAGHGPVGGVAPLRPERVDTSEDTEIVTLTWTRSGQRIYVSDPGVNLPFIDQEGLSRPRVNGEEWIVYTSVWVGGVAQAAQRVVSRHQMAGESAAKLLPPMLVLVVVVGGLLVFGLRRGLVPLGSAARDIAERSATALEPIAAGEVPREITPLLSSINGLISRLGAAFSAQRRFLADAAHELRTPITALRLQLQLLRRSSDPAAREEAMHELEAGIARSQRLIEQLLQVARSEPDGAPTRMAPVDLGELARSVVGRMSIKAEQRNIDLGAAAGEGIVVQGDVEQLTVLLNNLVANALRHAPPGGVIDVEAVQHGDKVELRVIDNGPGIPEAERERVFDRFHRGTTDPSSPQEHSGSGLGLAIVQAIAQRHGATVSLHTPASGRGLEVRVGFAAR